MSDSPNWQLHPFNTVFFDFSACWKIDCWNPYTFYKGALKCLIFFWAAGTFSAPHRTAPHRTAPHRTAPHRTAPHRTAPHRTAPHRTAPHRTRYSIILTNHFAPLLQASLLI
ncbi:hypothetical protein WDW89_09975 [Deltaproteobacteria bacterium TL4]